MKTTACGILRQQTDSSVVLRMLCRLYTCRRILTVEYCLLVRIWERQFPSVLDVLRNLFQTCSLNLFAAEGSKTDTCETIVQLGDQELATARNA
jgi:hypothetical protein